MKKFLPILVVGAVIGFVLGKLAAGADGPEFIGEVASDQLIMGIIWFSLSLLVSFFLQIIIHEAGHLVMGLFSGYRFVSFRIMNLLITKNTKGKLQVKKFAVSGTGGQCLLAPPAYQEGAFPYKRYLWGGVLANAVASLLVGVALGRGSLLAMAFVFVGVLMIVTNGLPMQYNDARTIQLAGQSKNNQRIIYNGLEINQLSAKGVAYAAMPAELFAVVPPVPQYTYLNTQQELMQFNRLMDNGQLERGWHLLEDLWGKKDQVAFPHFQAAIDGELMGLLCLLAPTDARIETLWQNPLLQQLLKQPLMGNFRLKALYAKTVEKNERKAIQLVQEGLAKKENMPTVGEALLEEKLLGELLNRWQGASAGLTTRYGE